MGVSGGDGVSFLARTRKKPCVPKKAKQSETLTSVPDVKEEKKQLHVEKGNTDWASKSKKQVRQKGEKMGGECFQERRATRGGKGGGGEYWKWRVKILTRI